MSLKVQGRKMFILVFLSLCYKYCCMTLFPKRSGNLSVNVQNTLQALATRLQFCQLKVFYSVTWSKGFLEAISNFLDTSVQ